MATPAEQRDLYQQRQLAAQQQPQRERTKPRSFSVRSEKSHRSSGSKSDVHESKGLQSKADPSMAINEAEPATMAVMEQFNHGHLRSMQHKDAWGNTIMDPDKSNPTRNRWERPLDTIRGFEAAIEGGYSRKSLIRSETQNSISWSQHGSSRPPNQARFTQDGSLHPQMPRNSYYDPQQGYGGGSGNHHPNAYGGRPPIPRDRSQRLAPDPNHMYGQEQHVYPMPHKDRSYETVTSVGGNTDPAGYQTDPTSSDNSSVDHRMAPARRVATNHSGASHLQHGVAVGGMDHGHSLPSPPVEPGQFAEGGRYEQPPPPSMPSKQMPGLRRQVTPPHHEVPEKRKSWFSRRFSKGG